MLRKFVDTFQLSSTLAKFNGHPTEEHKYLLSFFQHDCGHFPSLPWLPGEGETRDDVYTQPDTSN
jgi:hypothetical protein